MCVIVFSKKGVDAPTEEKIRDMFRANPDGAGYAYEGRNGRVYFKKGLMTVDELLEELRPLERWKRTNLAVHFRIGTAGKNDAATCHPFRISTQYEELREITGEGPVLFHNGILDDGGGIDVNSSDTQDFVAAFAPLLRKYSRSVVRDKAMEKIVDGSRMLIMYGRNKYKMYGEWEKDGDLLVSNTNYKWYGKSYYMPNYGDYGYYAPGLWDEWWEEQEMKQYEEQYGKLGQSK